MLRTILVADDNLTVQRMASEMLSEEGMDVITVANGMAAIKKLPDVKPFVVVADVDMPGKNGYEVCDFVKSQPELGYVRVLLVVSDSDPLDGGRGAEVRADGIVKKPFDRQEFVSLVAKSLGEAQALCPAPHIPEPPAAPAPSQERHEQDHLSEPPALETLAREPIERTEILDLRQSIEMLNPLESVQPNEPIGLAGIEEAAPITADVAGETTESGAAKDVQETDPAPSPVFETNAEYAHDALPEVQSEITALPILPSAEPDFTSHGLPESPESLGPPIVDWPAGLMTPLDSLSPAATLDGLPPHPEESHTEGAESELLESPLPDLPALNSDLHHDPEIEPAPLPDLTPPGSPEAYFSEEHNVTELPDFAPLPTHLAGSPALDPAASSGVIETGAPETNHSAEHEEPKMAPVSDDLTGQPPRPIDALLVSAVIHAVVARMAPPALPQVAIESLERQLAEEIMPDLTGLGRIAL
ncbi:MAG TPA: response regulator [Terriglobia bacterium]|nr:response regulator [Terriglobia bacterium]